MLTTEELWTRFRGDLQGYLRRRTRDEHLAEDLLQEVFVRVHDGLGALEDEERVGAWLYRVARNVLADQARREQGTGDVDAHELTEPVPEEGNANAEVRGWLGAMIARLPDGYRRALELSELQGLPLREVALRLGLTESGAKSRVQRGRRRLHALLSECCHFDLDRRGNVLAYVRRRRCRGCDER